ncbi:MAG: hypothetical protein Q7S14_01565 [bacterium]|nr:hypothetical protein [bacterium]
MELDIHDKNLVKIFTPEKETFLSKLQKDPQKYLLAQEILLVLAGAGILSMMVLMPGLGGVLSAVVRAHEKDNFKKRLMKLKSKNMVKVYLKDGKEVVEITKDGITTALKYKFANMQIKRPGKWDGKWRIVIFDVPDGQRHLRDSFRTKLQHLGFYQLNESVYVYPYPCFEEIEYLRNYFFVGGSVTLITAEKIEGDDNLSSIFHLKSPIHELINESVGI